MNEPELHRTMEKIKDLIEEAQWEDGDKQKVQDLLSLVRQGFNMSMRNAIEETVRRQVYAEVADKIFSHFFNTRSY